MCIASNVRQQQQERKKNNNITYEVHTRKKNDFFIYQWKKNVCIDTRERGPVIFDDIKNHISNTANI